MRTSKLKITLIILIIVIAPLTVFGSYSDSTNSKAAPELHNNEKWKIEVSPYFWAPDIKGNSTVAGTTASLDLSFKDIIDNFDVFGISTRVTAWKGNWELIFDGLYIDLDGDFSLKTPGPAVDVDVDITEGDLDFALGYRLFEIPIGNKPGQKMSFVPYGGFR